MRSRRSTWASALCLVALLPWSSSLANAAPAPNQSPNPRPALREYEKPRYMVRFVRRQAISTNDTVVGTNPVNPPGGQQPPGNTPVPGAGLSVSGTTTTTAVGPPTTTATVPPTSDTTVVVPTTTSDAAIVVPPTTTTAGLPGTKIQSTLNTPTNPTLSIPTETANNPITALPVTQPTVTVPVTVSPVSPTTTTPVVAPTDTATNVPPVVIPTTTAPVVVPTTTSVTPVVIPTGTDTVVTQPGKQTTGPNTNGLTTVADNPPPVTVPTTLPATVPATVPTGIPGSMTLGSSAESVISSVVGITTEATTVPAVTKGNPSPNGPQTDNGGGTSTAPPVVIPTSVVSSVVNSVVSSVLNTKNQPDTNSVRTESAVPSLDPSVSSVVQSVQASISSAVSSLFNPIPTSAGTVATSATAPAVISVGSLSDNSVVASATSAASSLVAALTAQLTGTSTPASIASEISSILASASGVVSSVQNAATATAGTASGSTEAIIAPTATSQTPISQLTSGPQSIQPTGTDSATSLQYPTGLGTAISSESVAPPSATATGIPKTLPAIINPPDGQVPAQPNNTTLIQVGFNWELNYGFVVQHWGDTVYQIFDYLPQGLSYGLGIDIGQVVMHTLQAYDTQKDLGYITTLALAYIPDDKLSQLSADIHLPAAQLYTNPQNTVRTLMNLINRSIPVQAGAAFAGSGSSLPGGGANGGIGGSGGAGDPFSGSTTGGSGNGGSSTVNGTSVGIGVGVVAGAAVYGAAMFLLARRYRQKKAAAHARNSSLNEKYDQDYASGALLGYGGAGGAMMAGGRGTPGPGRLSPETQGGSGGRTSRGSGRSGGTSARGQISAPVMAENSLGWN